MGKYNSRILKDYYIFTNILSNPSGMVLGKINFKISTLLNDSIICVPFKSDLIGDIKKENLIFFLGTIRNKDTLIVDSIKIEVPYEMQSINPILIEKNIPIGQPKFHSKETDQLVKGKKIYMDIRIQNLCSEDQYDLKVKITPLDEGINSNDSILTIPILPAYSNEVIFPGYYFILNDDYSSDSVHFLITLQKDYFYEYKVGNDIWKD
jgi:hypothetical protein